MRKLMETNFEQTIVLGDSLRPREKCACFPASVHTSPLLLVHFLPNHRRSVHASRSPCTLPPFFSSISSRTAGEVCMLPDLRAHFPPSFRPFPPEPPEKCACFPTSVHTSPPLFVHFLPNLRRSVHASRISCTLPPPFRPFPPEPPEKCACFPTSVHTSPLLFVHFLPNHRRSVHASRPPCTLHPSFRPFPPEPPEKCACFPTSVHTSPSSFQQLSPVPSIFCHIL